MKRIISFLIAVLGVGVVAGGLAGVKGLQIGRMVAHGEASAPPPETVTVAQVHEQTWESVLTAVGSLEAVQGVTVAAEAPGRVTRIAFDSGADVKKGALLVQQDVSVEQARLAAAKTELALARKNKTRLTELLKKNAVAQSAFDDAEARHDTAAAEVDNIRAIIAQKTIHAPFSGRLGIRQIDLGEILEIGQPVVSLQSLDPIYVNFHLPQQQIAELRKGLPVRVSSDAVGSPMTGTITAINSEVDSATRNVRVQATLENDGKHLKPGMYADVAVVLPTQRPVLAIPVTAVHHAPYGDSVFVVEKDKQNKDGRVVRQQFVQLGKKKGDFVAVRSGLEAGETVVSTGVFKLRNGQMVVVDNTVTPEFKRDPRPENA